MLTQPPETLELPHGNLFRMRFGSLLVRAGRAMLTTTLLAGCGDGTAACVTGLSSSCSPLYAPTFDNVFSRTLSPTCAQPGGVCHASPGVAGGLLFITADASYAQLLGQTDGTPRVAPGNPSCSTLVERIYSTDATQVMPPGAPLSDAERCAIVQWISSGAKR